MRRYIVSRTLQTIFVLFIVVTLFFILMHLMPGSPFTTRASNLGGRLATIELNHDYGFDKPILVQYIRWIGGLSHGYLGVDLNGTPMSHVIAPYLLNTLSLTLTSFLLSVFIAIPWGIHCGFRPYGFSDLTATVLAYFGYAIPVFALGIEFQQIFAMDLFWLPPSSMYTPAHEGQPGDFMLHMVLPVTVLSFGYLVSYIKYTRNTFLEILPMEFIRAARAKGASEMRVLFRHAFKNALVPIITVLAMDFKNIIGGTAVVEIVFNWPGMGSLLVHSAQAREYPRMLAIVMITSIIVTAGNWLADMLYAMVDPRIRLFGGPQNLKR